MENIRRKILSLEAPLHEVRLEAHVELIYKGKKDTISTDNCDVYEAICSKMQFIHGDRMILEFRNHGKLITPELWDQAEVPNGITKDDYRMLNEHFLADYRALMGSPLGLHSMIYAPDETIHLPEPKIVSLDFDLLCRYIEAQEKWLDAIVSDSAEYDQRAYEVFSLKYPARKTPCSFELWRKLSEDVLKSYRGMDLADYYEWYLRSANYFEGDALKIDISEEIAKEVSALLQGNASHDHIHYQINRTYKIHPRHRDIIKPVIDELIAQLEPSKPSHELM